MGEETVEQGVEDLTPEERAKAWEDWVKKGVNDVLDLYLPHAIKGDMNFNYSYVLKEVLESGNVYDDSKINGVLVSLVLEFDKPLTISNKG